MTLLEIGFVKQTANGPRPDNYRVSLIMPFFIGQIVDFGLPRYRKLFAFEPIRILNKRLLAREMRFEAARSFLRMEVCQWLLILRQSFTRFPTLFGNAWI